VNLLHSPVEITKHKSAVVYIRPNPFQSVKSVSKSGFMYSDKIRPLKNMILLEITSNATTDDSIPMNR